MTIETFRGTLPRCRHCGKPLRPNYKTVKEGLDQATGKRLVPVNEEAYITTPPDDPTKKCEERVGNQLWRWSVRKQKWFVVESVHRVKSRKFLGTFGSRGDGFFCQTECGYRYAVRLLKEQPV